MRSILASTAMDTKKVYWAKQEIAVYRIWERRANRGRRCKRNSSSPRPSGRSPIGRSTITSEENDLHAGQSVRHPVAGLHSRQSFPLAQFDKTGKGGGNRRQGGRATFPQKKSITMEHTGPRNRNTFVHHVESARSRPRIACTRQQWRQVWCEPPL
jgi:hypothetical protein